MCREYSVQLNAARIKVLQAQDDVVNSIKQSVNDELVRFSKDKKAYRKLLKDLIYEVRTVHLSI